ncbi:MAG: hypothetical protein V1652_01565 [bacterium]
MKLLFQGGMKHAKLLLNDFIAVEQDLNVLIGLLMTGFMEIQNVYFSGNIPVVGGEVDDSQLACSIIRTPTEYCIEVFPDNEGNRVISPHGIQKILNLFVQTTQPFLYEFREDSTTVVHLLQPNNLRFCSLPSLMVNKKEIWFSTESLYEHIFSDGKLAIEYSVQKDLVETGGVISIFENRKWRKKGHVVAKAIQKILPAWNIYYQCHGKKNKMFHQGWTRRNGEITHLQEGGCHG